MSWTKDVYSSNVASVGWDDATNSIIVTFKNGRVYAYSGADEEMASELSKAASVTEMLNLDIKGRYAYRRLR